MLYYLPIGKITIKGQFKDVEKKEESAKPCQSCTPCPKPKDKDDASALTTEKKGKGTGTQGGDDGATGQGTISVTQLTISLSAEEEADTSAGIFYATPRSNDWYEDEVSLKVNKQHLLSTGNVTTEDKTVEIVGTLASIAARAAGIPGGPFFQQGETPAPTATPKPIKFSRQPFHFSFHPSIADEVQFVVDELQARGIDFSVKPVPMSDGKAVLLSDSQIRQLGERGLVFRPAISYKVTIIFNGDITPDTKDTGNLIKNTQQFIMPDPTRLYSMEYPRMPFVKKVKNIGFTDGMLSDYNQKVPSPILGFLGIPKAIVEAVVPIPGGGSSGSASSSSTTSAH